MLGKGEVPDGSSLLCKDDYIPFRASSVVALSGLTSQLIYIYYIIFSLIQSQKSCHTAEVPYVFASMNVLHSNYSALSPYAQKEAPSPPEYPYTEFLSTVMTAAAKIADESSVESEEGSLPFQNPLRNSTKAFRRVVKHFFGEYYLVNADDELANDMVNRWSSFAKKTST